MPEYQKVRSTLEISRHIAFSLDTFVPQYFGGISHAESVRHINDILQGRSEQTAEALLGDPCLKGPALARDMEHIRQDIQAFEVQKELLAIPYAKSSDRQYAYKTYDYDPSYPLKIIDQPLYDQAAKDGFPPDFFGKSYFNGVTFYCLPDNTDFNFSVLRNCTFAVCRIKGATFDGTRIYDGTFHSCDMYCVTFYRATIAHTHFRDSALSKVSFQSACLKSCNTIDCEMAKVNFLNTTLDGCSYGRVTPTAIKGLPTANITQGGATAEECAKNRSAVFQALHIPYAAPQDERPAPPRRRAPSER